MWNDYVLCTASDIRARLTSPEMLLVVTKTNNQPISFTASGNTLTSGIPHGLLSWSSISFTTTGTPPAPLVAGTTYYAIVLTPSTIQVTSILGGSAITLTTAGTGTNTLQNISVDSLINGKIILAKRKIYNALLLEVQSRVPMIAQRWMNRKRGQTDYLAQELRREFEILGKTAQVPIIPGVYDGSVIDLYMLLNMTQGLVPRTFSNPSAPINGSQGTYAGMAYPGAVYIDSIASKMYYNTGTLLAPIWTHPVAAFVLNNLLNANGGRISDFAISTVGSGYAVGDTGAISGGNGKAKYVVTNVDNTGAVTSCDITNNGINCTAGVALTTNTTGTGTGLQLNLTAFYDSVLLEPAVDYTLWRMAEDGMFRNTPQQAEVAYGAEGKYSKACKQSLAEAVPLLDLDIDGDGVISDFEAELFHQPPGVFA